MKSLKLLVGAVAAVGLWGCGGSGQARTYRMAYDSSPLNSLPATCYTGQQVPVEKVEYANAPAANDVIFWDGEGGNSYVQLTLPNSLGDAALKNVPSVIEGKDKDFSATITDTSPQAAPGSTKTTVTTYEVKLDQTGDLIKGTLNIHYSFTSQNPTPAADAVTDCSVSIPFVGRKLDHDQTLFLGGA